VLGVAVYDADSRARQLMVQDPLLVEQIKSLFGDQSYDQGVLNRKYLAQQVFNDSENVTSLNRVVHPAVAKDYSLWFQGQDNNVPYVLREAALMIESGSYKDLDVLITVVAPVEVRIRRIEKRDPHRSRQQIQAIIGKQLLDEERAKYAHHVIHNDDHQMVLPQVLSLHEIFLSQKVSR
jgi:dephospho-CoA kinase